MRITSTGTIEVLARCPECDTGAVVDFRDAGVQPIPGCEHEPGIAVVDAFEQPRSLRSLTVAMDTAERTQVAHALAFFAEADRLDARIAWLHTLDKDDIDLLQRSLTLFDRRFCQCEAIRFDDHRDATRIIASELGVPSPLDRWIDEDYLDSHDFLATGMVVVDHADGHGYIFARGRR